jgi:hypothetical protein
MVIQEDSKVKDRIVVLLKECVSHMGKRKELQEIEGWKVRREAG